MRLACYAIWMSLCFKIVLGLAVFWWWIFFGSHDHCPRCGCDLVDRYDTEGGLPYSTRRRSCACGWHE